MTIHDKDQMHPDDLKNLLTFIVAAIAVWVLFDHFLLKPKVEALRESQEIQRAAQQDAQHNAQKNAGEDIGDALAVIKPREEVIGESPRIKIQNENLFGSLSLTGGRIDDISLHHYYKTKRKRHNVSLFSPMGAPHPRYTSFGWISSTEGQKTPGKKDKWTIVGKNKNILLTPDNALTLYWENGTGLRFERDIEIDDQFMFKIKQRVINKTGTSITLHPYALMAQHGLPEDLYGRWIILEGLLGYVDKELIELSYKKIKTKKGREVKADQGWIAITDRYWFTGLFPEKQKENKYRFIYTNPKESGAPEERYQVDVMGAGETLNPLEKYETVTRIYVGPKKLNVLEAYGKKLGWEHIDLSIDFGMYYFMTKPLFYLLHWLGRISGNFGLGIIMLTVLMRLLVFPLANTSYRSFAKLRKISPEMAELKKKYMDDKEGMQKALVKLYEKEKVNPMAGCLPILIQIPIFFALFKVLQISVEMRHAPFYGWVHDLSAPDPTSVFNLFGLIPWTPPTPLMIGAWPVIMLFFMILQKKMNPPPQDKMQKTMTDIMPFFITSILSKYAVGLVIYWTFSNALSVVQQYIIMKSMGVEPHLFKSKEQKEIDRKLAADPATHPGLKVLDHEVEEALFGEGKEDAKKEKKKPLSKPKPKKAKPKKAKKKKK